MCVDWKKKRNEIIHGSYDDAVTATDSPDNLSKPVSNSRVYLKYITSIVKKYLGATYNLSVCILSQACFSKTGSSIDSFDLTTSTTLSISSTVLCLLNENRIVVHTSVF